MKSSIHMQKLLVIGICLAFAAFLIGYSQPTKETRQLASLPQELTTMLSKLEHEAWQKLSTLGIQEKESKQTIAAHKKTLAKKRSFNRLSTKMKNVTSQVLKDFGVSQEAVSFAKTNEGSPAWADDSSINIDEKDIQNFSAAAQKWTIGHELQHVINGDSILHGYMQDHMIEGNQDIQSPQHGYNCHSRFCELRADITTALKSEEYARGYLDFCNQLLKKNPQCPGRSHPKLQDRKQLAEQICRYHQTKHA